MRRHSRGGQLASKKATPQNVEKKGYQEEAKTTTSSVRLGRENSRSTVRIKTLASVRVYINAIDFGTLKRMLIAKDIVKWTSEQLDEVEHQYKNWLFLRRKYENDMLPPTEEIDQFWHAHLLDTRAYHRDCARIFGYYLHHFPYFGLRGPDDRQHLFEAFEQTQRLYKSEFGHSLSVVVPRSVSSTNS